MRKLLPVSYMRKEITKPIESDISAETTQQPVRCGKGGLMTCEQILSVSRYELTKTKPTYIQLNSKKVL